MPRKEPSLSDVGLPAWSGFGLMGLQDLSLFSNNLGNQRVGCRAEVPIVLIVYCNIPGQTTYSFITLHSFDADLVSEHITYNHIQIDILSCFSPAVLRNHRLTHNALFLNSPWTVTDGATRIRFRIMLRFKTNETPLSNRP
jgi:hypothetical protein